MKWLDLSAPWDDQVKGSWWKAPLLMITYFYLRLVAELRIYGKGLEHFGITIHEFANLNEEQKHQLLTYIEWPYFLLSFLLTIFVVFLAYYLGFRFFKWRTLTFSNVLKTVVIFFVGLLIQGLLTSIIYGIDPEYIQPINQTIVETMVQNMNKVLMFINIVILTPIVEEYLLRGLIMKYTFSLLPKLGALVAAIVFALLHSPQNLIDFSIYFLLSFVLTGIYWYTRRLEYPILMHMIQNFLGFITI